MTCDNTNCPNADKEVDTIKVEMREEFEGGLPRDATSGWFNWCEDCINRDKDMIEEILKIKRV